jgi:hypothetical protein
MLANAKGAPLARRSPENDDDALQAVVDSDFKPADTAPQGQFSFGPSPQVADPPKEELGKVLGFKRKRKVNCDAQSHRDSDQSSPSLLDFFDRTTKAEPTRAETNEPCEPAGTQQNNADREAPRASARARPKPAVIEPIASHRLAREPWLWRNALLASSLPPGVKVVGVTALEFINRKTGVAFPGNDEIAARCGMAEDTVRKHIAALVRVGRLTAKKTKFRGSYDLRLTLPGNGQSGTDVPDCSSQSGATVPANSASSCRPNRHGDAAQSGTEAPSTHYTEPHTKPFTKPHTEPVRPSASGRDDGKIAKPGLNPFDQLVVMVDELIANETELEKALDAFTCRCQRSPQGLRRNVRT